MKRFLDQSCWIVSLILAMHIGLIASGQVPSDSAVVAETSKDNRLSSDTAPVIVRQLTIDRALFSCIFLFQADKLIAAESVLSKELSSVTFPHVHVCQTVMPLHVHYEQLTPVPALYDYWLIPVVITTAKQATAGFIAVHASYPIWLPYGPATKALRDAVGKKNAEPELFADAISKDQAWRQYFNPQHK
jgi:hypothetical protein